MQQRRRKVLVTVVFIALVTLIIFLAVDNVRLRAQNHTHVEYTLLSPSIAWLSSEEFIARQETLSASLAELRPGIEDVLDDTPGVTVSVYVEDLTTGAWTGVNERGRFLPANLLKVPVMVATFKAVERGRIKFNDTVTLEANDIDLRFGPLGIRGAGTSVTVRELLEYMIVESDNTALRALGNHVLTDLELDEAMTALGFPPPELDKTISPKDYGNTLRALYYSSFLRRTFSENALSLMLNSDFDSQLPAGVPKEVPVAHKIGIHYLGQRNGASYGFIHDCGIVYVPERPYSICVMTANATHAQADRIIPAVNRVVYTYFAENELPEH